MLQLNLVGTLLNQQNQQDQQIQNGLLGQQQQQDSQIQNSLNQGQQDQQNQDAQIQNSIANQLNQDQQNQQQLLNKNQSPITQSPQSSTSPSPSSSTSTGGQNVQNNVVPPSGRHLLARKRNLMSFLPDIGNDINNKVTCRQALLSFRSTSPQLRLLLLATLYVCAAL